MATRPPSEEMDDVSKALQQSEAENAELKEKVVLQGQDIERLFTDVKRLASRLDDIGTPVLPPDPNDPDPDDPEVVIPPVTPPLPPEPDLPPAGLAHPTFHSVGLYLKPPSNPGDDGIKVEYKKATDAVWKLGHPLWYDLRNAEARGSIVYLTPDTEYDVRFSMPGEAPYAQLSFRTWTENFPIATTTKWAAGPTTAAKVITVGGNATDGYALYTSADGGRTTITRPKVKDDFPINIKANYVIVRAVTCLGGQSTIHIEPGRHHVIIEDCDLSDFGRDSGIFEPIEQWQRGWNRDSGITVDDTDAGTASLTTSHIVIQRNKIHDPAFGANSWVSGHPRGPQGITMPPTGGHHVIRYNEIYSNDQKKWFNDGIGGGSNFSAVGFPSNDSDIYRNIVKNCWDDAIEAEGGGKNVRIWANYTDRVNTSHGSAVVHVGPTYYFRNVLNRHRGHFGKTLDGDKRERGFKVYTEGSWGNGKRYMYHNTTLQWPGASEGATRGLGCGEGISGPITFTKTRNNILHTWTSNTPSIRVGFEADLSNTKSNDFNYDLRSGPLQNMYTGAEANVGNVAHVPNYKEGHGDGTDNTTGLFQLEPGTPGHDQGEVIPNFNDDFLGVAPDCGAHEEGSPAMKFGLAATGP